MSAHQGASYVYVDSSVLVALLAPDDPSHRAVRSWSRRRPTSLLTSAVTELELGRALRRRDAPPALRVAAGRLLARLELVEITAGIRGLAVEVRPSSVRSLDALHVATALAAQAAYFATLDTRQSVAAEEMGLALVPFN